MAYLNDIVLDALLQKIVDDATALHICSQQPANYAAASATYSLGTKSDITIGAPGDRAPDGRKVTVGAISDGAVTATGTASHWAIVDDVGEVLLAAGTLAANQEVTSGNPFTLAAFDIGVPDAVAA